MKGEGAITDAPASTSEYWVSFSLNLVFTLLLFYLRFRWPSRVPWTALSVGVVGLFVASQAAARLFQPREAAKLSAAFTRIWKERILFVNKIAAWSLWVGAIVSFGLAAYHADSRYVFQACVLSAIRFPLNWVVQDLLGMKAPEETEDFEHSPPLVDLRPLQSTDWEKPSS